MEMTEQEIEEAAVLNDYGTTVPTRLRQLINMFLKRKSAFCPEKLTISDFAVCCILYDMTEKKARERKA